MLSVLIVASLYSFLYPVNRAEKQQASPLPVERHINSGALQNITDSTQLIISSGGGVLMLYANATLESSNGRVQYAITYHDSRKERYNFHLDISLADVNGTLVDTYKSESYHTTFVPKTAVPYWVDLKKVGLSIDKAKRSLIKKVHVVITPE